jgi:hypothetical protein
MRRTALIAACLLSLTACAGGETEATSSAATNVSAMPESTAATTSQSAASATAVTSSSTATPSPSADPIVADQALVRSLYYGHSQAFRGDLSAGAAYEAAHNHPDFRYTAEECASYLSGIGYTDAYTVSTVPDVAAMALDPGWALPASRYVGTVPSGRVYILPLTYSESDTGFNDSHTDQVHVSVLDGAAYYFQPCE